MDTENGRSNWITIIAERKIEEAIAEGVFDNLPGKGKPLVFDDDPLTPAHLRIVNKVLHNAGVAPTWLSLEQEIEDAKAAAEVFRAKCMDSPSGAGDIDAARAEYLKLMKRANDLILQFNIVSPFVHRSPIPLRIKERLEQWDAELRLDDPVATP